MTLDPAALEVLEDRARRACAEGDEDVESLVDQLSEFAEERGIEADEDELAAMAARVVVEAEAASMVAAGYDTREEILDALDEMVEEEEIPLDEDQVTDAADRAWERHLTAQRGWPDVTDCERLDEAFTLLNESGIVAREHFTCCQNCGLSEIAAEVPQGADPEGYVFFHQQDTDRAVAGGGLLLAFGTFTAETSPDRAVHVGQRVVAALEGAGLRTVWNGSHQQRITVDLAWQRRR